MSCFNVAGYVRLSKEDKIKDESNSVTNQKAIMESYIEKNEDLELFSQILDETQKIVDSSKDVAKFLKKKTHLYSLFLIVYYFIVKQGKIDQHQIDQYKKFVEGYNNGVKLKEYFTPTQQKNINEYKKLSSTGTQGKSNRITRNNILKKIME